jgi:cellulose biosynthesis protein BcsQ
VTVLTIGVTSARFPACKRGLAVNLAASLARDAVRPVRVCVVDADPARLDVTTRFAVRGPCVEDLAERPRLRVGELGSVHEPPLWVLPSTGAGAGPTSRAVDRVLPQLRPHFDVVICDLGTGHLDPALLAQLDWLLVAVTPEVEPVAATARFLEQLDEARRRRVLAETMGVGIVTTGDETSSDLDPEVVAKALRRPVVGSVRQLWGRAAPNLGFGAALGIAELDDAVAALFGRLGGSLPQTAVISRAL